MDNRNSPNQDRPQEDQKNQDFSGDKGKDLQVSSLVDQPSQFTDMSRYMLNATNNDPQAINDRPPKFVEGQNPDLIVKREGSPLKDSQNQFDLMNPDQKSISQNMLDLKNVIQTDNDQHFLSILRRDIQNHSEVLMVLYACALCFNSEDQYNNILISNSYFEFIPEYNLLFCQPNSFAQIQTQGTIERSRFEYFVLKAALENEFFFMVELVLSKAILNKDLLILLLKEDQTKILVDQIFKPHRPLYYDHANQKLSSFFKRGQREEKEVHFTDMINAGLEGGIKSKVLINLMKLMRNELQTRHIEHPDSELNFNALYSKFVLKRKIKLLRYLFSLNVEFIFTSDLFLEALELEAYDIASLLYREFFRKIRAQPKETEFFITVLISSLTKNNGMIEFKSFLLRQFLEQFMMRHAIDLLDAVDTKISQENKTNIILMNLNTVKTCCLLIELLELVASRFEMLAVRAKTIRQKIIKINKQYMAQVEHEREMRFLLLEKDFENRDSLDLITKYEIQEFLESQFAENVVKEIWRSPYATNNQIFSASTNHNLTFNFNHFIKDEEIEKRFYNHYELKEIEAHPLQFTVWRYSAKSRMLVEFCATVIMSTIIHYFIWKVLKNSQYYQDAITDVFALENSLSGISDQTSAQYVELSEEIDLLKEQYEDLVLTYYNSVMVVSYLSFLCLFYALQHINDVIFTTMNKRYINPYSVLNMIDLLIFAIFFCNILVTYSRNQGGTWSEKPAISRSQRAWAYAEGYDRGYVSEDGLWICCIIIMWVRSFYLIRYHEGIGKFIAILERLLYEVLIFFGFYLVELVFFTLAATLFFRDLENYNTFPNVFVILFYASFRQFTFDDVALSQYGYAYGVAFQCVFLIVNLLLVMNMFISIINVLWDALSENKNVFQMLETLKIRPQTEADDDYSSLVSLPTPLNVILVFATPCLLTSKNPEKFNVCLLMVGYIPVLGVSILLFLVYNMILWIFAYVKLFFHKLIMIMVYSKSFRVSRSDKFMNFVVFTVIGWAILLINIFVDTWRFISHMLLKDLFKTKHKTSDQKITKQTLKTITGYFRGHNERVMPYRQVAMEVRELLEIMESLIRVLRPKGLMRFYMKPQDRQNLTQKINMLHEQNEKLDELEEFGSTFSRVKEYSTLKQILERNSELLSVKDGVKVKSIDCKILSAMLVDIVRHEMVLKVEDENYIFIRRARNLRQKRYNRQAKYKMSEADEEHDEDKYEEELRKYKRLKVSFKRLLFLNTRRMLAILKHKDVEQDRRRLAHSVKLAQQQGKLLDISVDSKADDDHERFRVKGGKGLNVIDDMDNFEMDVFQMTQNLPKINSAIEHMKYEITGVMSYFQKQNKGVMDKEYQKKLTKLIDDLEHIKDDKDSQDVRKNVISNYFYKEENAKPELAQKNHQLSNQKEPMVKEDSDVPDVEEEEEAEEDGEEDEEEEEEAEEEQENGRIN